MRFKDLDHFRSRHPDLAELLERGGHDFLVEMREKVVARENLTPKQLKALKRWVERDAKTVSAAESMPRKGEVVRDELVTIIKVYEDPAEGILMMEFVHPDGWRGRLKDVKDTHHSDIVEMATARGFDVLNTDKARASGGKPFGVNVLRANVIWSKKEAAFCIFGKPRRGSGSGARNMMLSLPVDPLAVEEAAARAKSTRLAAEAEAVATAIATVDIPRELADKLFGHDWIYNNDLDEHTCVGCDKTVTTIAILTMTRETREGILGSTCRGKVEAEAPVLPESAPEGDEPRGKRGALLPDFNDWRNKLSAL